MGASNGFPKEKIRCMKCGGKHYCQRHRTYPREFFKVSLDNVALCYDCHTELHLLLGGFGKLRRYEYEAILKGWLSSAVLAGIDVLIFLKKFAYLRQMASLSRSLKKIFQARR